MKAIAVIMLVYFANVAYAGNVCRAMEMDSGLNDIPCEGFEL